jgi:lipid-binding SYLF domain-containing protein
MRTKLWLLVLMFAAAFSVAAADETSKRVERAANTVTALTESGHGIPDGEFTHADCVAVIPGFRKVAAVVGVGHGRGFITCRNGDDWSAPGAITLDSGTLGVEIGGEDIDIVVISLDPEKRSKLLSDRFAVGSEASAAWGNGKSAQDGTDSKVRFYGRAKGVFAGFGLGGVTIKPDESGDKALYGKKLTNKEIVNGGAQTPAVAQPLMAALAQASAR